MARRLTLPRAVACFCLGSGEWDQAGDTWKDLWDARRTSNEDQSALHEQQSYHAVDKQRRPFLLFKGWQKERLDRRVIKTQHYQDGVVELHPPLKALTQCTPPSPPPPSSIFIAATLSFCPAAPQGSHFSCFCLRQPSRDCKPQFVLSNNAFRRIKTHAGGCRHAITLHQKMQI